VILTCVQNISAGMEFYVASLTNERKVLKAEANI